MQGTKYPNNTRHVIALAVLLLASLAINVLLAADNMRFRRAGRARLDAATFMREGATEPPFSAKRLDGSATTVLASDVSIPTAFYAFTPQCHWCTKNLDNLAAVVNGTRGRMRFIGVALSERELKEYLEHTDIRFDEVLTEPTTDTMNKYQLFGTPRMIVVNPDSTVSRVWNGAYTSDVSADVAAFFGVALPGLREVSDWRVVR